MAKMNLIVRESGISGIKIETWTNKSSSRFYGRLIDFNGQVVDGIKKITRVLHHTNEITRLRENVGMLLREEWNKKHGDLKGNPTRESVVSAGLCELYDKLPDPHVLDGNWVASTSNSHHSFLRKQVLPAIDVVLARDGKLNEINMAEVASLLQKKSLENKRNYKDTDSIARFQKKLERINLMLKRLYSVAIGGAALTPQLPVEEVARVMQREQQKWLNQGLRDALAKLLLEKAATESEAVACALMFCVGLRTSEAAAVCFGDITIMDNGRFAILYIEKQIDSEGRCVSLLKTENAYRMVILPVFFIEILNIRIEALRNKGFTVDEIKKMHVFDLPGKPSSLLSGRIKNYIIEAGMQDYDGVFEAMNYYPDIVDGKPETDPTAYILRRDWATRATALGLTPEEIDYCLGHSNDNVKSGDFLVLGKQREIANKLEKYTYLQELSMHPYHNPIRIQNDMPCAITIEPVRGCRVINDSSKPTIVMIKVRNSEPGCSGKLLLDTEGVVFVQ